MIYRSKAPLRVSFAGGGTDVPPYPEEKGGVVLTSTINRFAYATLREREDEEIFVNSLDYSLSVNFNLGESIVFDGKLDLVAGVINRFLKSTKKGFELHLHSDAPPGSGLGSSSAMVVALVGVLNEYCNLALTDYEIANLAIEIERKDLGIKGGLQDQYAATFGGFNFIEFYKNHSVVNPLRIKNSAVYELQYNLLLAYTKMPRLSSNIIDDQVNRYKRKMKRSIEALDALKNITIEMKNLLLRNKIDEFGSMLHEEWKLKKMMSNKISNDFVDDIYETALQMGALGGKLSGAGGGGYMILYCANNSKHKIANAIREKGCEIQEFDFEFQGLQTWNRH